MAKQGIDEKTLQLIKQVILEEAGKLGVKIERIILFGSRARGEARPDSDYDILIIASDETKKEKLKQLRRALYMKLSIPADIITITTRSWIKYRYTPGTIAYEAAKEGIPVA